MRLLFSLLLPLLVHGQTTFAPVATPDPTLTTPTMRTSDAGSLYFQVPPGQTAFFGNSDRPPSTHLDILALPNALTSAFTTRINAVSQTLTQQIAAANAAAAATQASVVTLQGQTNALNFGAAAASTAAAALANRVTQTESRLAQTLTTGDVTAIVKALLVNVTAEVAALKDGLAAVVARVGPLEADDATLKTSVGDLRGRASALDDSLAAVQAATAAPVLESAIRDTVLNMVTGVGGGNLLKTSLDLTATGLATQTARVDALQAVTSSAALDGTVRATVANMVAGQGGGSNTLQTALNSLRADTTVLQAQTATAALDTATRTTVANMLAGVGGPNLLKTKLDVAFANNAAEVARATAAETNLTASVAVTATALAATSNTLFNNIAQLSSQVTGQLNAAVSSLSDRLTNVSLDVAAVQRNLTDAIGNLDINLTAMVAGVQADSLAAVATLQANASRLAQSDATKLNQSQVDARIGWLGGAHPVHTWAGNWSEPLTTLTGEGLLHGPFGAMPTGVRRTMDLSGPEHAGHGFLRISFLYYAIDSWDFEQAYVSLDNVDLWRTTHQFTCDGTDGFFPRFTQMFNPWNGDAAENKCAKQIDITIPHSNPTAVLEIGSTINGVVSEEAFWFSEPRVFTYAAATTALPAEFPVTFTSGWTNNRTTVTADETMRGPWGGDELRANQISASDLPAHSSVRVRVRFFAIDNWTGYTAGISIDGVAVWSVGKGTPLCDALAGSVVGQWMSFQGDFPNPWNGVSSLQVCYMDVDFITAHSSSSLTLALTTSLPVPSSTASWAFLTPLLTINH